jgi:hypothetical protein
VTELRSKLVYHIGQLYEEVTAFLTTLLPTDDPGQGSVLIVDGLEKLRGTSVNDVAVQESVQALFVAHASKLKFCSHHMIYTVPTYLQLTAPGALPFGSRVLPVPVPHVRPRPGKAADTIAETVAELRDVVSRRLPVDQIFAGKQFDTIIQAPGGHLRDLFTLLPQVVNLMLRRSLTPPLRDEHVEEAIGLIAHDFMKMTAEQKAFLRHVASGDGTVDPLESEVQLMARLLQSTCCVVTSTARTGTRCTHWPGGRSACRERTARGGPEPAPGCGGRVGAASGGVRAARRVLTGVPVRRAGAGRCRAGGPHPRPGPPAGQARRHPHVGRAGGRGCGARPAARPAASRSRRDLGARR